MSDIITIVVRSKIVDGKLDELKQVLAELVAHMKETEKDCLSYEWYLYEESMEVMVVERYANSDAVLFHMQNYQQFVPRMEGCRTLLNLSINGNASDTLKKVMADNNIPGGSFFSSLK